MFCLTTGLNFLLVPFLAYGIGRLVFPGDTTAITGIVLIGTLPTSGRTPPGRDSPRGTSEPPYGNVLASLLLGAVLLPLHLRLFVNQGDAIPVQVQAAAWFTKLAPGASRPCTDCRQTDTEKMPKRSPGARRRASI